MNQPSTSWSGASRAAVSQVPGRLAAPSRSGRVARPRSPHPVPGRKLLLPPEEPCAAHPVSDGTPAHPSRSPAASRRPDARSSGGNPRRAHRPRPCLRLPAPAGPASAEPPGRVECRTSPRPSGSTSGGRSPGFPPPPSVGCRRRRSTAAMEARVEPSENDPNTVVAGRVSRPCPEPYTTPMWQGAGK